MAKLVVFEGNDLAGKSTTAKLLTDTLVSKGVKAKYFAWDSTNVGQGIKRLYTTDSVKSLEAEILLLFSSFSELENEIKIVSRESDVIIVDRYLFSTYVYQCVVRNTNLKNAEVIRIFETLSPSYRTPDLVLNLKITRDVQLTRMNNLDRPMDSIEERLKQDDKLFKLIDDSYHQAFTHFGQKSKVFHIDATQPPRRVVNNCLTAMGAPERFHLNE